MKTIGLITLMFLIASAGYAQQATAAGGGDIFGSGGSASYTVGEPVNTSYFGSGGSALQGVQHAYEVIAASTNELPVQVLVKAYPNPVDNELHVEIPEINSELNYVILDMNSRVVRKGILETGSSTLVLGDLPSSTFIFQIKDDRKVLNSFRIIKK